MVLLAAAVTGRTSLYLRSLQPQLPQLFPNLTTVCLSAPTCLGSPQLGALSGLPRLLTLSLQGCIFLECQGLSRLTTLTELDLRGAHGAPCGAHLSSLTRLTSLELSTSRVRPRTLHCHLGLTPALEPVLLCSFPAAGCTCLAA